jgi:Organic Anion Transporter Polypeptide (OATP) family
VVVCDVALAVALPGAVGSFAGGLMMSKLRLTPTGAVRVMIIAAACFATGLLVIVFLSCPQVSMAGRIDSAQNTYVS